MVAVLLPARTGMSGTEEEQDEVRLAALAYSTEESDELSRRKLLLFYYLLRSPMYQFALEGLAGRTQRMLAPIPIARSIVGKGIEILEEVHTYHFHTDCT